MTSFKSPNDCQSLQTALQTYGLPITQAHLLKQNLLSSLMTQQDENFRCLSSPQIACDSTQLLTKIDSHLESIDELLMWLSHHSTDLSNHRTNIRSMENNNQSHSIKVKNQSALIDTLKRTIDTCQMQSHYEELLMRITKPNEIELSLTSYNKAANELGTVLKNLSQPSHTGIDPSEASAILQMRAIQQQLKKYSTIRVKFSQHVHSFLQSVITERLTSAMTKKETTKGVVKLPNNTELHKALRRYTQLTHRLRQFNLSMFEDIKHHTIVSFNRLWNKRLTNWFSSLQCCTTSSKSNDFMSFAEFDYTSPPPLQKRDEDDERFDQNASLDIALNGKQSPAAVFRYTLRSLLLNLAAEESFVMKMFYSESDIDEDVGSDESDSDENDERHTPVRRSTAFTRNAMSNDQHAEVNNLLSQIFGILPTQLSNLVTYLISNQSVVCIELLLIVEQLQQLQQSKRNELSSKHFIWFDECLSSLYSQLAQSFEQFIKFQIQTLQSTKMTAKRSGVLSPVKRMLTLIYEIQSLLSQSAAHSTDSVDVQSIVNKSIGSLLKAMSQWIVTIAATDEKYTHLVVLENNYYLYQVFSTHFTNTQIASFKNLLDSYHLVFVDALMKYVQWHLQYEMSQFVTFFIRLQSQRSICVSVSDVQYSHSLSKSDLRVLTREKLTLKSLTKSISNIYKRIEKHILLHENNSNHNSIGDDEISHQLNQIIWSTVSHITQKQIKIFDELVKDCYGQQESVQISISEIQQIFNQISPTIKLESEIISYQAGKS